LPSCPKCGAHTEQLGATGKGICPKCDIVEFTPASTQIDLNQSKFCQYCGKELTVNFDFCPNCGKPLTLEAKASTFLTPVATSHKPSNVWYLVPIVLTLLGSVIGYFALKDRDKRMARNLTIVGVIMPFVWIGMIAAIASLQVAPEQQPQIVTTTVLPKTVGNLGEIKDLAYIQVNPALYTDDADPEYEGINIFIDCFDTKSRVINFRNTPILVDIELYGYHDIYDSSKGERGELVYKTSRVIDHSYTLQWESSGYLRISFADIFVDQTRYVAFGTAKVMVQTAKGNFTASQGTLLFNPPK
jgi:hypothetical protein